MNDLQTQLNNALVRIDKLEKTFDFQGGNFEELIRNAIFFDQDTTTSGGSSTSVVIDVTQDPATKIISVTKANVSTQTPTKYVKIYFRGVAYLIGVIAQS